MTYKARKLSWLGGAIGAVVAMLLGLGLLLLDFYGLWPGENLADISYDVPFLFRPVVCPTEVVLVYLDEASHRDLNQPYTKPWDRGVYARLLDRLSAERAKAVAFDILFSDPNTEHPQGDEAFTRALKANGKVVLGADYTPAAGEGWTFLRGLDSFSDAAAAWGMVQTLADQDFMVRRQFHVPFNPGDDLYSSLSWQVAKLAGVSLTANPQERFRERWVNYYGPRGTIPNISIELALETNGFCPAGFFANKVVFVGSSVKTQASGERRDEFRTPYTGMGFGPGVDVQATQALNLIRGDWLTRVPRSLEVVFIILAGLIAGAGLAFFRPLPALGLAIGLGLLVTVGAYLLFVQRLWFPWFVIAAVQIPSAFLWSVVFNSVQLYVQNRLYEQSLRMYLPPKLVKKFSANKALLRVGAEKQVLTLLFTDIADFTTLTEGMEGDELASLMNSYFQAAVGNCIHRTDGTVVKYLGDAIFAFWNAPEHQPDHALRACEAALRFRELNNRPIQGRRLRTRMGLHTGVVNVGNFGSEERVDYTALGENVNLASRLEGLNKFLGTECLLSGQTKAELGENLVTRALGMFRLKGFEALVEVHELVGFPDQAEATRPWREAFAEALKTYEERNLEFAAMGFRRVLELHPGDGPAQFYLKQIAERASEELTDQWATYTVLKEK
jgi:adenylate cyclase